MREGAFSNHPLASVAMKSSELHSPHGMAVKMEGRCVHVAVQ